MVKRSVRTAPVLLRTLEVFKFPTMLKNGRLVDFVRLNLVLLIELIVHVICSILLASVGQGFGYTLSFTCKHMILGNGMISFLYVWTYAEKKG